MPPVSVPAIDEPVVQACKPVKALLGVSTNLLYDALYVPGYGFTSAPSLSVEYYPQKGHYTFGADVEFPLWRHPREHRYFQVNNLTLWGRRYFKPRDDQFKRWYLLANVNLARYGIGFDAAQGWEGEGIGLGIGGGYKFYLSRRVYMDVGLAAGVFYTAYDPYVWGDDPTQRYYYDYYGDPADFVPRSKRTWWFGPTRVYFSIGVDLFNRYHRKQ